MNRSSFIVEGMPITSIDVASFRRHGSTWRGLLKADFSSLAAMLRRVCGTGG